MGDLNLPEHWSCPVLTGLTPQTDGGRWPVRRFLGDEMIVQADLITEGHECIAAETPCSPQTGRKGNGPPHGAALQRRISRLVGHWIGWERGFFGYGHGRIPLRHGETGLRAGLKAMTRRSKASSSWAHGFSSDRHRLPGARTGKRCCATPKRWKRAMRKPRWKTRWLRLCRPTIRVGA